MIDPGTTVHCAVMSGDVEIIEQIYRVEAGDRSLEIDQVWRSSTGEQAGGGYGFAMVPDGCRDLRFRGGRDGEQYSLAVDLDGNDIVMRSGGEICARQPAGAPPWIFDCGDPMLDWFNTFMIIGLQQGESARHDVHYIDLRSCTITRRSYRFTWVGETVTIFKSADPRHDCSLWVVAGETFSLRQAGCGGYIYYYE